MTEDIRLRLKPSTGWFAAGVAFRQALLALSDGAFRLFAYVCLEADRRTGRLETTHRVIAQTLGISRRVIGSYVAELDRNQICRVHQGANQFARTVFEIADEYWPYEREHAIPPMIPETARFVWAVRETFLSIACGSGRFTDSDVKTATQMQTQGIPLSVVQDAILLGACRKYITLLNGGSVEPIGSLRYFDPIVAELRQHALTEEYRENLRVQSARYGARWKLAQAGGPPGARGYQDKGVAEIVR